MGFALSLILTAVGAVLAWAVDVSSSSVDVNLIGIILLIVGIVGMLLSLAFWSSWAGPGYFTRTRRTEMDSDGHRRVTDERTRGV